MKKVNKTEVNYSPGMKESHCGKVSPEDKGYCEHYYLGTCDLVYGTIKPTYWCSKFEKAIK